VQGHGPLHDEGQEVSKGLYANIAAKKRRIKLGSDEKMRKPGDKGAPTAAAFKASAKTAKKAK
jgi:ActR/RegA family two-component response regulator